MICSIKDCGQEVNTIINGCALCIKHYQELLGNAAANAEFNKKVQEFAASLRAEKK